MTASNETTNQNRPVSQTRPKSWLRRILWRTGRTFLLLYLLLFAVTLFFADSLMFVPPDPTYSLDSNITRFTTPDGLELAGYLREHQEGEFIILYSHGNGEDLGQAMFVLDEMYRRGYSVFGYDYRGYGINPGSPSEEGTYNDILGAFNYLINQKEYKPEQIIVWGRSIGTGPSCYLAANKPVGGLVMESGFTSVFPVATKIPLLPFDKFKNIKHINKVGCPVWFVHSESDQVVAFRMARKLYQKANEPKMKFWAKQPGHNELIWDYAPQFWDEFARFVQLIEKQHTANSPE